MFTNTIMEPCDPYFRHNAPKTHMKIHVLDLGNIPNQRNLIVMYAPGRPATN